jgi:N-acetylglucosamine malate deacetylase 2
MGIPDQQAALELTAISTQLARQFLRHGIEIVLTLAYEGGHPDHDATAFCAHRAVRRLESATGIVEMPLYRAGDNGALNQSFAPDGRAPVTLRLTSVEWALKSRMVEAHATQKNVLAGFSLERELFRVAPTYDFLALPNGGKVLYDREDWGMNSAKWLEQVRSVLAPEHALS